MAIGRNPADVFDSGDAVPGEAPGGSFDALVRCALSPVPNVEACVVFPAPDSLPRGVLRHMPSSALLRLMGGAVWMLATTGQNWTAERLDAAAVLVARAESHEPAHELGVRLSETLELPVQVLEPFPVDAEAQLPARWRMDRAVMLLLLGERGASGDAAQLALRRDAITDALTGRLRAACAWFSAMLDAEAVAVSGSDARLYNYLVTGPDRGSYRPRIDFARTYPLLAVAVAAGQRDRALAAVRDAIDTGLPLLPRLSCWLKVKPGAVRALTGVTLGHAGARWAGAVRPLATLLDVVRPEDRPGLDLPGWAAFNRAVETAERLFRCPPWASAFAAAWMREALRAGRNGRCGPEFLTPATMAGLDGFREAAVAVLRMRLAGAARGDVAQSAAGMAVHRFIAGQTPRGLARLAKCFDQVLASARRDLAAEVALIDGSKFPPLFAEPRASDDGRYRLVPLTDIQSLREHGAALDIGLGGSHLTHLLGPRVRVGVGRSSHSPARRSGASASSAERPCRARVRQPEPRPARSRQAGSTSRGRRALSSSSSAAD